MWVRGSATSQKARCTGAVELHLYAASYGRWLLSKAHPPPSPFGVTGLLLTFGSLLLVDASGARVTTLSDEVIVEYFVMGPLTDEDVAANFVAVHFARARHFHLTPYLRAVEEMLGPDRISGLRFLVHAT